MPLKNCQSTFSLQRTTSSSSLRLKLCFKKTRLAISRIDSLGRRRCWCRHFDHQRGAEHVVAFEDLAGAFLAFELGRSAASICAQGSRAPAPRGIAQVDHRVDASAEKVGRLHPRIPRNPLHLDLNPRKSSARFRPKTWHSCGLADFAGATQ